MSNEDVLVLAEIQRGALADATLELLAAARGIVAGGGEVVVLAPGENAAGFAPQLAAADRILVVDDPLLAAYSPEPYLAVLEQAVAAIGPKAVLIASTFDRLGPGADVGRPLGRPDRQRLQGGVRGGRGAGRHGFVLRREDVGGGRVEGRPRRPHAPARQRPSDGRGGKGEGRNPRPVGPTLRGRSFRRGIRPPRRRRRSTLPSRTSSSPSAAASNKRTTSNSRKNWPGRWAEPSAPPGRSSTRVGCRRRGKWASRG